MTALRADTPEDGPVNTRQSLDIERQRLLERFEEQPEGRVFAPLADCHRKLGDLDEALRICSAGLARHPEYSSAYVILGKIQLERGEAGAARAAFERVLEIDSHNLLALRQLAEIEERSGNLVAAEERWQQVASLEIEPQSAEARIEAIRERRAQATVTTESHEEPVEGVSDAQVASQVEEASESEAATQPAIEPAAVSAIEAAIEPTSPVKRAAVPTAEIATMTLAEIYSEQGFKAKALEIYRQILERNPDVTSLAERIGALEDEMARPVAVEPPSSGPAFEEQAQEADLDELEASIVPTPITQLATAGRSESVDEVEEPGARPSPPLESPVRPGDEARGENERFNHFRSWLDRIRVDEN